MRRTGLVVLIALGAAILLPATAQAAPAPMASPLAAGAAKPLAGLTIAIDPGHNGGNASHPKQINRKVWIGTKWKVCNTVGTSTNNGYAEHKFTWRVANKLKKRLEALGATVKLTRPNDTGWGPCSTTRGKYGAKVHAKLMISLHGDGLGASQHGFVVIRPGMVKGYTDDIYARSKTLALDMRYGLVHWKLSKSTAYGGDGLDVRTDLGTLNLSDVPVVMVELGNMRNAHDAGLMSSGTGQARYANGLVAGIRRYLHK